MAEIEINGGEGSASHRGRLQPSMTSIREVTLACTISLAILARWRISATPIIRLRPAARRAHAQQAECPDRARDR
jgi:hypothetical protein